MINDTLLLNVSVSAALRGTRSTKCCYVQITPKCTKIHVYVYHLDGLLSSYSTDCAWLSIRILRKLL
jgi:hypothetical protein